MKRALVLLAIPVAAFGLVACGDDDDNDPDNTADLSDITLPEEITVPDISLPDVSLPDEITIPDISLPDVSLPDEITIPDISLPDISIPDNEELIAQIFPNLDEDQVNCLAEEFEGDTPDPDRVLDLLDECNINARDLLPG